MNLRTKSKTVPGTLVYTGKHVKETKVKTIQYNEKAYEIFEKQVPFVEDKVSFVVVEGLSDVEKVRAICAPYKISNLIIEDILHVEQRNKIEIHDNFVFVVLKHPYLKDGKLKHGYISFLLVDNGLISFSETENNHLNDIVKRIEDNSSLMRKNKNDYLLYVLLDLIIDELMEVNHFFESKIEVFEENLLELNAKDQVEIYKIRKEMIFLRNVTTAFGLNKTNPFYMNTEFFSKGVKMYYHDMFDHLISSNNRVANLIENTNNILDVFNNNMANKMNQIMTTLTIFSAIFIPLSFLTGIFGMNFVNFPILQNQNGMILFTVLSMMIPVTMITYFKLRKWF